ncbi:zinc-dependent alcohol dehydrogenase (plasmid) [Haloferacaceae archaeon DSL9]
MKAIVQTAVEHGSVAYDDDWDVPQPGSDEALVKVHTAGLCGSDAHAFKAVPGFRWVPTPRVMGHEYSGEVVEVGGDVQAFSPGDKVIEEPIHDCGGYCFQCRNGQTNVCADFEISGFHHDGGFAEYSVVKEQYLHKLPDDMPLRDAALTEPTAIAARAVLDRSVVDPGDNVLVEGPGPIGALTAAIAHSIGANVTVSGLGQDQTFRLPLVEKLGPRAVNVQETPLEAVAEDETGEVGFDVIFDTTGHHSGVENAAEVVRRGGQIVVVGLPASDSEFFFTPLVRGEVELTTSYGSTWRDFEKAIDLINRGAIDADAITDDSYSVEEPVEAFESFLAGEACKPIFQFD